MTIKLFAATLALIAFTAAAQVNAACAGNPLDNGVPLEAATGGDFVLAQYRPVAPDTAWVPVGDFKHDESIVGLWKFRLSGFITDFGTQAFHQGGTETMFSAGVNPATGDVCQGVWRKVGPSTYTLNHIAMAWTAPGAQYGVLIRIHMTIRVAASGDSFSGAYKAALFSTTPQDPFDESVGAFASGSGTLSGTRVKPD
jgi:hypothetical protein